MLARNYRLSSQNDFNRVFKQGKRAFSGYFRVFYCPNNLNNSRLAVVVSNKVSKKATARNLLKRQVREILRKKIAKFRYNLDIIINILPTSPGLSYKKLEQELAELFKKTKIF
jgi:ribonuclease P protein component